MYNVNVNYVCRNVPVSCTYSYVSTFTFTLIQVNIYIYIYGIIGFVALIAYGTWSVFYQFAANIPNSYKYVFFMRKKNKIFLFRWIYTGRLPWHEKVAVVSKTLSDLKDQVFKCHNAHYSTVTADYKCESTIFKFLHVLMVRAAIA